MIGRVEYGITLDDKFAVFISYKDQEGNCRSIPITEESLIPKEKCLVYCYNSAGQFWKEMMYKILKIEIKCERRLMTMRQEDGRYVVIGEQEFLSHFCRFKEGKTVEFEEELVFTPYAKVE